MKDANDTIAKKEHDNRRQEALLQEVGSKANTVNEKVQRCPRCCYPALSRAFVALKALFSLDDKHTALMDQLNDLAALRFTGQPQSASRFLLVTACGRLMGHRGLLFS